MSSQNTVKRGNTEISRLITEFDLPTAVEEYACTVFSLAKENDLLSGRSVETSAASSVLIACQQEGMPISVHDIANKSQDGDKRELTRTQKKFKNGLGLETPPPSPHDYIGRFGEELGLEDEATESAEEMLEGIMGSDENIVSGRSPTNISGSLIYTAARLQGKDCTQREVEEVADVSGPTIRKIFRETVSALVDEEIDIDTIDTENLHSEYETIQSRDPQKYS